MSTIFKNFLSLFASEVITRILGTVLTIYVARTLGVKSFGQLAFAAAFISYFNIFADLGLTNFGIREIAKSKTKSNLYATHILVLQVSVSLLLLLLMMFLVNLIPLENETKIMILLFGLGMIATAFDMSYLFQAHEKMGFIVYAKSLSQIVYALLGFVLIYLYKNIVFLPAANLIGLTIGSLAFYFLLRKYIKLTWSELSYKKLLSITRAALPFLAGALMIHVYSNSNTLLLQFFKGIETVGLYNAPSKIILFIAGLGGFLTWAVYPALSKSYHKNRNTFNRLVKFSAWVLGLVAIPLAIGGLFLSNGIINLIYGTGYIAAVPVFSILISLPVFIFLNCIFGNALSSSGHQKISTWAVTIAAISNLILNFIFIPKYGIMAAAVVTVATEIFETAYLYFASKEILKIEILSLYFIKPLIASIPMGLVIYLLSPNLPVLLKIISGFAIYLTSYFVIGGFKQYNQKI